MRRALLALVVLVMVAAACGDSGGNGNGGDGDNQALVDAIKAEILETSADDPDAPVTDAEATCVAEGAVDRLGVDGLLELGITAEGSESENPFVDATDEQLEAVTDIYLDCIDVRQLMLNEIGSDVSQESAECVADSVAEGDFLRPVIIGSLRGEDVEFDDDPELAEAFVGIVVECLTPEELVNLGG